ncbi:hypothetical protein FHX34_103283 [Actinoplanes teichomyceticus]|uniref:Secreted protein n=1 Tax=Actinoplanes teichomyceticus TaxID=1867 RepID=A0A561WA58_ACTTI|nr:hypothetical protein FHX34_103283 [Actinoplanes teichomyceticus]GIF14410.1 hypothetical protein Ate01nite_44420 [Actinoplanes teichomyceticus]
MDYRDGVPAVLETTRATARQLVRSETPARLRLWSALVIVMATVLLAATSLVMARVREQVRVIGREAAPQAVTAADLYVALSDMDAQVTRLLLTGGSDALAGTRVDALGAYRQRSRQADADLQRSLTTASGPAERAVALDLLDGLAVYHQRIGQTRSALDRGGRAATEPGRLPPDALGHYTQATNILHLRLLPDAQRLRDAATARLDRVYAAKRATEATGITLAVLLGGALLALLVLLQRWLTRRFHRTWNPALLAATALGLLLVLGSIIVLTAQAGRLSGARDGDLTPYLSLSRLRAIGYDAAADSSRYLVSANLAVYRDGFTAKAYCLGATDPLAGYRCGPGLAELAGDEALRRWQAYQRDHERVLALADSGRTGAAVDALTGIRRGDAAFDFAYFDAAMGAATDVRRQGFDRAWRDAERVLRGWVALPLVVLALIVLLVAVGVRRRLAEYR